MTIAVLNASGAQARVIADRLSRDHSVRRLSRATAPGLTTVDPEDETSLARAFDGATAVVFTAPLDYRPGVREAYAERVVAAAGGAGVGRIVLNTAAALPEDAHFPVVETLRNVRAIVQAGPTPVTVVQPTIYLDNLLGPWVLPGILNDGVLASPAPEEAPVSQISHAALADFIAAAIGRPDAAGRVYDIGGPEALTGPALASIVSRATGREVRYHALDLGQFAAGLNAAFGAPTGDLIADGYRYLAENPEAYRRGSEAWDALGVVPETAAQWTARQTWSLG